MDSDCRFAQCEGPKFEPAHKLAQSNLRFKSALSRKCGNGADRRDRDPWAVDLTSLAGSPDLDQRAHDATIMVARRQHLAATYLYTAKRAVAL